MNIFYTNKHRGAGHSGRTVQGTMLWRTGRRLPEILYYPNTATNFIVSHSCDTQILIITRRCQPVLLWHLKATTKI
jgi:hypothetical protein